MIAAIQTALIKFIKQQTSLETYSYVPSNIPFPYIHIDKVISRNWSSKTWEGLDVNFKCNIYDKNTTNIRIMELSYILNQAIPLFNTVIPEIKIIKIITKDSEISFNKANNLYQSSIHINILIIKE